MTKRRFDALAGYSRTPRITALTDELAWFATPDERILGILLRDLVDGDFSWVAMARDEILRFRAVDVGHSIQTLGDARQELISALERLATAEEEKFYQGDTKGKPVDFFRPISPEAKLHPNFKALTRAEKYLPARDIIASMMRYHKDLDGNYVQQFQTTAFDARLWELYFFATFTEMVFARDEDANAPDFVLVSNRGPLAVEATTVNPPDNFTPKLPKTNKQQDDFINNYMVIKLARALRAKLTKKYWEAPLIKGIPFVLAVQDFSFKGSMTVIDRIAVDYLYGWRHSYRNGRAKVTKIAGHRYKTMYEPSGFFDLPDAENVSAVIINPQGTLPKFNRMGYLAGFGPRDLKMTRSGVARGTSFERPLVPFTQKVYAPDYQENWVEGMVVLHNPNAKIALEHELIPGALHKCADKNGDLDAIAPDFHPLVSRTAIGVAEAEED